MENGLPRLGPREQQIVDLLLQGCDNAEIAKELKMAPRTVKAHFYRLFLRFGIQGGIKRVKLAVLLYRRMQCRGDTPALPATTCDTIGTDRAPQANGKTASSN